MSVSKFADMVEEMSLMDLSKTPNAMFIDTLSKSLYRSGFPSEGALKIATSMKVDLASFDPKDQDWQRVVHGYAVIIRNIQQLYGENVYAMANSLSVKYTF